MNERIRELAELSAQQTANDEAELNLEVTVDDETYSIPGAFIERFAELIIRECIGCCESVISDPVPESVDTWLNGGSQCIDEIKQHFGVE